MVRSNTTCGWLAPLAVMLCRGTSDGSISGVFSGTGERGAIGMPAWEDISSSVIEEI